VLASLALLAVAGLIVLGRLSNSSTTLNPPVSTVRFRIPIPEGMTLSGSEIFSLSPDGRTLVYIAERDGRQRLWAQSLDSLEPRALPDSGGLVCWSADSRFLFFSAHDKLLKLDLSGDPSQAVGTVRGIVLGCSSNAEGTIILGTETSGILRMDAKRDEATPVTTLKAGERVHAFPSFLPDGRHFIYSRISSNPSNTGVFIGSLDDKPSEQSLTRMIATPIGAQFVAAQDGNGTILFQRESALWAQDFDASRLQLKGEPRLLAEHVGSTRAYGFFAASKDTLVHRNGLLDVQLTWFDRHGQPLAKVGKPADLFAIAPRISPDGTRIAVTVFGTESTDIWVHDIARGVLQRITSNPAIDQYPKWAPDGKRLVFSSSRTGHYDLYEIDADGGGREKLLYASNENKTATNWSPNGRFLLYSAPTGLGAEGIWALPLDASASPTPVVLTRTRAREREAVFSPDSRWIAFVSDESGTQEVYVRSFSLRPDSAEAGPKILISRDGGHMPHWRADGKEILYRSLGGALMSVAVTDLSLMRVGAPQTLFQMTGEWWDATADGSRFLVEVPVRQGVPPFTVVLNWQAGRTK